MIPSAAVTTSTAADRHVRVAAARRSPELANAHDERAWLELYADDAIVEDPVGSPPAQRGVFTRKGKKDDLERFYEVFIAPTAIRVEERGDTVVGDTVMRDVVLHVQLRGGARASIATFLEYDLVHQRGGWKVRRMRAYWDSSRTGRDVVAQGFRGKLTSLLSGIRLLRVFGRGWTSRYASGTKRGIRKDGAIKLGALEHALAAGDRAALDGVAAKGATVTFPGQSPSDLRAVDGAALDLAFDAPICSGFHAVATFRARHVGKDVRGVGVVSFDETTKLVTSLRLLWETPQTGA